MSCHQINKCDDVIVRTTLTIDDDIAGILQRRARELGTPFKELVNAALRKGLVSEIPAENEPKVQVRPHDFGAAPGIDMARLNQLADELEVEEYRLKAERDDSPRR